MTVLAWFQQQVKQSKERELLILTPELLCLEPVVLTWTWNHDWILGGWLTCLLLAWFWPTGEAVKRKRTAHLTPVTLVGTTCTEPDSVLQRYCTSTCYW